MKLKIMSDLHLEFSEYIPQGDSEEVLILAGDTHLFTEELEYSKFLEEVSAQFKAVVCVAGNHEYYHYNMSYGLPFKNLPDNVHFLDDEYLDIEDVRIIGSTLWTDFKKEDAKTMADSEMYMNDFRIIRKGKEVFSPSDALDLFNSSVMYIKRCFNTEKKVVVVTHHAPSYDSIAPQYWTPDNINGAFASNLNELILDYKPILWVHGHTHNSFDYKIGDTRIVCNPRGYCKVRNGNPRFNPDLVVEV